jgi:hypothetical protein
MTCTTQVIGAIDGNSPSRLPMRTPPESMVASSSAQCPNITTTRAVRRATSTARSRLAGVASASVVSDTGLVSGMSPECPATGRTG